MVRRTTKGLRRPGMVLATLALVAVTVSASHAWAGIPHTTTGAITACRDNSSGALRVVDAEQGASCAAGETTLVWNATPITATRWRSTGVKDLTRVGGVTEVVLHQPGNKLPAGSWLVTATVLIVNSQEANSFRCSTRTRGTLQKIGAQLQDYGGEDGWHNTMTIPGLITLTEPDWIDVHCSKDFTMSTGGYVRVESVEVIAQRVASVF